MILIFFPVNRIFETVLLIQQVIWAKLKWRAIADVLPPGQSCNKLVMRFEEVPKF